MARRGDNRPATVLAATVAGRALVDQWHRDNARRRREHTVAASEAATSQPTADPDEAGHRPPDRDDTPVLLFLCCHPALSPTLAARADATGRRWSDHGRRRCCCAARMRSLDRYRG